MKRQVGGGEQARQAGQHVDGALQVGLEEEVQRALCRGEATRVSLGFSGVADDEAARELVEASSSTSARVARILGAAPSLTSSCQPAK